MSTNRLDRQEGPLFALLDRVSDGQLRVELARLIAIGWFSPSGYFKLRSIYKLSPTEVLVFLIKYGVIDKRHEPRIVTEHIGHMLGISGNTVRTHITHILAKLGLPGCKDETYIKKWAIEIRIFQEENP